MLESSTPWIVLSLESATAEGWKQMLGLCQRHLDEGLLPLIVSHALPGVPEGLAQAYELAIEGENFQPLYCQIVRQHRALCEALRLPMPATTESLILQLRRQIVACANERSAHPACKAKVLALGELLASSIGEAWLVAQGLPLDELDARSLLLSQSEAEPARHFLAAACAAAFDPDLARQLALRSPLGALTQAGIARDLDGETVMLADAELSLSYLKTQLQSPRRRLEILSPPPTLSLPERRPLPAERLGA